MTNAFADMPFLYEYLLCMYHSFVAVVIVAA